MDPECRNEYSRLERRHHSLRELNFRIRGIGLCVAHLGHLHHTLTEEHVDQLGRIDVLLVPVDGSYTLGIDGMVEVISQIKPKIIIPMHVFGAATLERFVERIQTIHPVEFNEMPSIVLSRAKLPAQPKLVVLPGNKSLNIEVGDGERVLLNELAPRLYDIAHEFREEIVGLVDFLDLNLQQRAGIDVERRLPQLLGIHLAEAFVALQGDALTADFGNRLE